MGIFTRYKRMFNTTADEITNRCDIYARTCVAAKEAFDEYDVRTKDELPHTLACELEHRFKQTAAAKSDAENALQIAIGNFLDTAYELIKKAEELEQSIVPESSQPAKPSPREDFDFDKEPTPEEIAAMDEIIKEIAEEERKSATKQKQAEKTEECSTSASKPKRDAHGRFISTKTVPSKKKKK